MSPQPEAVKFVINDAFGREIKTHVNQSLSAGSYGIEFYAEHLSSEVYFYQLVAYGFLEIKK